MYICRDLSIYRTRYNRRRGKRDTLDITRSCSKTKILKQHTDLASRGGTMSINEMFTYPLCMVARDRTSLATLCRLWRGRG